MPRVYVYNYATNAIELYYLGTSQPMPYTAPGVLSVGEFRANSRTDILWTDRRAMEAWNIYRRVWGSPIYVGFAFKRIWEGGHDPESQHYAGVAFDIGQNLSPSVRNELRNTAYNLGVWSYVEPAYLTPRWVHVDKRLGPPACYAGFPEIRQGSKGIYVFILQDALSTLGYPITFLDGDFGPTTRSAVISFQRDQGFYADGIVGCDTWDRLTSMVNGIGATGTTIRLY